MTFAIHGSKDGQSVVTIRISPHAAVDKARLLETIGWQVHITDSAGRQFDVSDFDRLLDQSTDPVTKPETQGNAAVQLENFS